MSISDFISRRLSILNAETFVKVPQEKDYISRVRDAVIRNNDLKSRVSIEVNNVDVSKEVFDKVKTDLPEALQSKKKVYESLGFCLEVI